MERRVWFSPLSLLFPAVKLLSRDFGATISWDAGLAQPFLPRVCGGWVFSGPARPTRISEAGAATEDANGDPCAERAQVGISRPRSGRIGKRTWAPGPCGEGGGGPGAFHFSRDACAAQRERRARGDCGLCSGRQDSQVQAKRVGRYRSCGC